MDATSSPVSVNKELLFQIKEVSTCLSYIRKQLNTMIAKEGSCYKVATQSSSPASFINTIIVQKALDLISSLKFPTLNISSITAWKANINVVHYMVTFEGSPKLWPISLWDEKGTNPNSESYFELAIQCSSWLEEKKVALPLIFLLPFNNHYAFKKERSYFACKIGKASIFKNPIPVINFQDPATGKSAALKELDLLKKAEEKNKESHRSNLKMLLEFLGPVFQLERNDNEAPVAFTQEEFTPFAQALNLTQEESDLFIKNGLIPKDFTYTPKKPSGNSFVLTVVVGVIILGVALALTPQARQWANQLMKKSA